MKLIFLFLLLSSNLVWAGQTYAQITSLNLELNNVSLEEVFDAIRRQSEFEFFYNNDQINTSVKVSIKTKNADITTVLEQVLPAIYEYTIKDRYIMINKRKEIAPVLSPQPQQQTKKTITGRVTDKTGETIIGANIMEKGTTNGTVTDINGNFILNVEPNAILHISYIGYLTQDISTVGRTSFDIVLQEDTTSLEEVVVVGYGMQRKITTIGAQSGIKVTKELKQPVATLQGVLSGRIAGIVGQQVSGEAGKMDNTKIWVRGIATTTDATPLILIDGVERAMNDLNAEDIESLQVLKDASATAVYGVKGANGVILITTKQGVRGKPRIRAEYSHGITNFTKVPDLADGPTYMKMANEASTTRGGRPIYTEEAIRATIDQTDPYLYPNINWFEEAFAEAGYNNRANVNVNGGSEFAQYYVSLGYYNEGGLYKIVEDAQSTGEMKFTRYNYVSNLTMQITKTTEAVLALNGYVSDYNTPAKSASEIFNMALLTYPTYYPVTYPGGEIPYVRGSGVYSPYTMLHSFGFNEDNRMQTNITLRLKQKMDFLLPGLSIRGMFAFDHYNRVNTTRGISQPVSYNAEGRDENGDLILVRSDNYQGTTTLGFDKWTAGRRQYYMEGALDYNQIFAEKHRVSGMFLYNQTDYRHLTAETLMSSMPSRSLGVAGRATYSFDDRYMAEFNFGYNGSENFVPGNRFGFFPSFGAGWVLSNEKFFSPLASAIQLFKIRGSWGKAGNSQLGTSFDSARRFAFLSTVGTGAGGYVFGNTRQTSYSGKDIQDYAVDVTWENSTKTNFGVDLGLWENDLSLTFDIFKEKREDIFLQRSAIPDYIGLHNAPLGNLGIVENKGFETSLDLTKQLGEVILMTKGNLTYNRNKIIEDDTPQKPYPWLETRGNYVHYRMGYICDGFYTQEEIEDPNVAKPGGDYRAGDLKYRDLNGDGIIDGNDKTSIGRPSYPNLVYGFGATVQWKNFDIGAFFQGTGLIDISLAASDFMPYKEGATKGNVFANITEAWTEDDQNPNAKWPRLNYGGNINENYATSTFWLRSGSYLRLKTLDIGYTLPSSMTKKWGVDNVRLYFLGYNLFTITSFDMWDPELGSGSGTEYPNLRTYSMGISLSF